MAKEELSKVRIAAEYDAMLSMARKYCGVIYGAIFAIILSNPDVVKTAETHFLEFRYLLIGLLAIAPGGIIIPELLQAYGKHLGRDVTEIPNTMKAVFFCYVLFGFVTFCVLMNELLK